MLNIYNLLNNIKFTKNKFLVLCFLKIKYHTKRKRKKEKEKALYNPHSKY